MKTGTSRNIVIDQATSLRDAKSDQVILLGLSDGSGQAARLAKRTEIAKPADPESLLIRHINRRGKTWEGAHSMVAKILKRATD